MVWLANLPVAMTVPGYVPRLFADNACDPDRIVGMIAAKRQRFQDLPVLLAEIEQFTTVLDINVYCMIIYSFSH